MTELITDATSLNPWLSLTRLAESEIILPIAVFAMLGLFFQSDSRLATGRWVLALASAILITAMSKILFIGWGLGSAALNFTGVSGHAMFASAVYPVLLPTLAPRGAVRNRKVLLLTGWLMALVVGVSRLELQVHSLSEVLAGWLLGGGVSAIAHSRYLVLRFSNGLIVTSLVAAWLALMMSYGAPSQSHTLITGVALRLSGHPAPYTRAQLLGQIAAASMPLSVQVALPGHTLP